MPISSFKALVLAHIHRDRDNVAFLALKRLETSAHTSKLEL